MTSLEPKHWPFEERPWYLRARMLRMVAQKAEWNVPATRIGGLIHQMRRRGRTAEARGRWLFALLFLVIILGLGYYVGLPIWQQLQDSSKQALEAEISSIDEQLLELDANRDAAWNNMANSVRFAASEHDLPGAGDLPRQAVATLSGKRALLVNANGVGFYSDNAGTTWSELSLPDFPVEAAVSQDYLSPLVETSKDGEKVWVSKRQPGIDRNTFRRPEMPTWVSTDGGGSWSKSEFPPDLPIDTPADFFSASGDRLVILVDSAMYSSNDFGMTWTKIDFEAGESRIEDAATFDSGLAAVAGNNRIYASKDHFETWQAIDLPIDVDDTIVKIDAFDLSDDFFRISSKLFEGSRDPPPVLFFQTLDGGKTWEKMMDSDREEISDVLPLIEPVLEIEDHYEMILEFSEASYDIKFDGSTITISESNSDSSAIARFPASEVNFKEALWHDGRTTVLFAFRDTNEQVGFAGSNDAGKTWFRYSVGASLVSDLIDSGVEVAVDPRNLSLLFFTNERAVRFDDRIYQVLLGVTSDGGLAGDMAMLEALSGVAPLLQEDSDFQGRSKSFEALVAGRSERIEARSSKKSEADQIAGTGFSFSQQQREFHSFLESCQADKTDCMEAYFKLRDAENTTIWHFIAERAPPAVLLLFLLATLGGLYRYNMRMTGFHHSRADALELLYEIHGDKLQLSSEDATAFASLSDQIAADKVEFGKSASPTDQAVELAKVISQKG